MNNNQTHHEDRPMPYTHRIYGKLKTEKRYRPFSGQGFCGNLIYALMFTESNAKKAHEQLTANNPEYDWHIRKI